VRQRRQSWRALEALRAEGKARSIGVSNFTIRHLTELLAETKTVPAVDQVEFHPYLYQRDLLDFCAERAIVLEAYSPLTKGARLKDPKLVAIAKKYSQAGAERAALQPRLPLVGRLSRRPETKSTAQILIRWALQHGLAVIPKSADRGRIFENGDVFDFEITAEDMQILNRFNENLRTCWDPTDAP
jgi:diketogulonate reductase-like aldo/keto reductase